MPYPTIVGRDSYASPLLDAAFDVPIPSGNAGDLLIMVLQSWWPSNDVTTTGDFTWNQMGAGTDSAAWVGTKTATGSEGSTVTIEVSPNSIYQNVLVWRIRDWTDVEVGGEAEGDATSDPNPVSFAPSWGSKETLWIALAGVGSTNTTIYTYPSGYSQGRVIYSSSSSHRSPAVACERELVAASENPGAFLLTNGSRGSWGAGVIAVVNNPVSGGGFGAFGL